MTPAQIAARRAELDRLTTRAVSEFELALAGVMRNLERRLRGLVEDVADGKRTAIIKAARAARLRKDLRNELTNAGFDLTLDAATDLPLERIGEAALATTVGQNVTALMGRLRPRIDALKALTLSDLLSQGDQVTDALWRATVQGVFSARPVDAILNDLAQIIDDTMPRIRTLYDTSISIYGRQVEDLQAGDDPETLFVYLGPVDAEMREFCEDWVGKVRTRADIDGLDNGQLPNVMLTGGGYNCRHGWTEISDASDLAPLAGTDQRMPEVDAQLRAVRKRAA